MTVTETKIFVKGSMGQLETVVSVPSVKGFGLVFLSHPHPLFGGSMENKVIYTLNKAFLENNWITVKHNFRGVGETSGAFDNGEGETEDLLNIVNYYRNLTKITNSLPKKYPLCFAGFSFGTYVSCKLAHKITPDFLLLTGIAAKKWEFSLPKDYSAKTTLIHGQNDEVIPLVDVLEWSKKENLSVTVIPGTDHFFNKQISLLKSTVMRKIAWMKYSWSENTNF